MEMINFFKGFWEGMREFGVNITNIFNFILLIPVYFIGVGIVSIIAKLFKKHFLNIKLDKNKDSYWLDKRITKEKIDNYYKQF